MQHFILHFSNLFVCYMSKYEDTVAAFWRGISRHLSNGPNVTSQNRWRHAILDNVLRQTPTVSCNVAPLALIEQIRTFGNRAPADGWWPLWVCIFVVVVVVVVVVVYFYKKLYFTGTELVTQDMFCLVWFDSLRLINNLSVIKGRVFMGWTSTKLGLMSCPRTQHSGAG